MNGPVKLGAVEVLSQNGDALSFNGYKPSYQLLPSYNNLIAPAEGKLLKRGDLSLSNVISLIESIVKQYHYQVRPLAKHLYSPDLGQACFNIWHFIKINIRYDFDRPGYEEVRTPARVWADRNSQNDCEDYSIFAAALLIEMGYTPVCKIVSFHGPDRYQHIYVRCGQYTIDAVLNEFNVEPKNITDYMQTNQLSGVGNAQSITTIAGVQLVDPHTQKLLGIQDQLLAHATAYGRSEDNDKAVRKTAALIAMAGMEEQEILGEVMHLVDDVDAKGNLIFSSPEQYNAFQSHYNQILKDNQQAEALHGVDEKEICGMDYEAENDARESIQQELAFNMGGLGAEEFELGKKNKAEKKQARQVKKADNKKKKEEKKQVKAVKKQERKEKKASKPASKVKTLIKKAGSKVSTAVKKVVKVVKKVNPLYAAARNAYLALVQLNFRGIATRMSIGLITAAEAKRAGYSESEHSHAVDVMKKIDQKWKDTFGGEVAKLHGAINRGKVKGKKGKAAFKNTNTAATIAKKGKAPVPQKGKKPMLIKTGGKLHGVDSWDDLEGLGALGLADGGASLITAAATILAAFGTLIGSIKARNEKGEEVDIDGEGFESTGDSKIDNIIKSANSAANAVNAASSVLNPEAAIQDMDLNTGDDVSPEDSGFKNLSQKQLVKNIISDQPGQNIKLQPLDFNVEQPQATVSPSGDSVPEGGLLPEKAGKSEDNGSSEGGEGSGGGSSSEGEGWSTGAKVGVAIAAVAVVAGGVALAKGKKGGKRRR